MVLAIGARQRGRRCAVLSIFSHCGDPFSYLTRVLVFYPKFSLPFFFRFSFFLPLFYTWFWGPLPFFILETGGLPHRPRPKAPGPSVIFGDWGSCHFSFGNWESSPKRLPPQSPRTRAWFFGEWGSCHFSFWEPEIPPPEGSAQKPQSPW